jgi:hypothetical protein
MDHFTTKSSGHLTGMMQASAMPAAQPEISEFERESQSVEAQLGYLEERIQVLNRRLQPVIAREVTGDAGTDRACPSPSSEVGSQLRGYSNRIESAAETVNYLLNQLVLP